MAINDPSNNYVQPIVQNMQNTNQNTTQNNNQSAPVQTRSMSFLRMGTVGGLSRTPTAEILLKAMNALNEEAKRIVENPWEVSLLPMDNAKETNLAFSGIIIAVRRTDAVKSVGVCYHTLILEGSGEPLTPRIEHYDGQQIEVIRATGDAFDEIYKKCVHDAVTKAFPGVICNVQHTQVVPRHFDFENKDAVHTLLLNAQLPCYTYLETRSAGFTDMNLTLFERDSTLAVRIGFNEPQKTDYAGLPVRNDINITLSANSNNRNNQLSAVNTQERSVSIASTGGYIDPIWAPPNNNPYNTAPQPKFAARFVITNMENVTQTTAASQLLALVSSLILNENDNWYPYFLPRPQTVNSKSGVDLRDIGAINIEGNFRNNTDGYDVFVDTKAASFTPKELWHLIKCTFIPGIHFSLRVSECGADTWYNAPFLAAAMNDKNAIASILHGANVLTGQVFGQFYGTNESPVLINNERVHLGYYTGSDGTKRDIADIDYLAVMNKAGKTDPRVGARWTNSFLRASLEPSSINMCLADRKKMIEDVVGTDVTYTGFARIVTFTNRFTKALSDACIQVGLDIRTINSNMNGTQYMQRSSANFVNQVQMNPNSSGIFNQGYNNQFNGYQPPNIYQGVNSWM